MNKRIELQKELELLIGSKNVYFQPPESMKLQYPCIMYSRTSGNTEFANDLPYMQSMRYQLVLIDKNPDSVFIDKLSALASCVFDRMYCADNLNHFVFNLYYN